jgi:hypothetical protein
MYKKLGWTGTVAESGQIQNSLPAHKSTRNPVGSTARGREWNVVVVVVIGCH